MSNAKTNFSQSFEKSRRRFSSFAQETTLHGFPDIHKSESVGLKVFWMIVLVLSMIAVGYEIFQLVSEYNERPILTLYDWKSKKEGLIFPELTICSENMMINYTKLKEAKIHWQIVESVKASMPRYLLTQRALNRPTSSDYYFSVFMKGSKEDARNELKEILKKWNEASTGHTFDEILTSIEKELIDLFPCAIDKKLMPLALNETEDKHFYENELIAQIQNGTYCNSSEAFKNELLAQTRNETNGNGIDYFYVHHLFFDKYLFYGDELNSMKFFGDFAFEPDQVFSNCEFADKPFDCSDLDFIAPVMSYKAFGAQCFLINLADKQSSREVGMRLVINANNAFSNPVIEGFQLWIGGDQNSLNERLRIPIGAVTSIVLKPTHFDLNVDRENETCVDQLPLKTLDLDYSENICRDDCLTDSVIQFCNCSYFPTEFLIKEVNIDPGYRLCKNYGEDDQCVRKNVNGKKTTAHQHYKQCLNMCRPVCNYWEYSPTVTFNQLPTKMKNPRRPDDSKQSGIDINVDEQNILRNDDFTVLEIRFADKAYVNVSQKKANTLDGLISQIGGIFGLFLGASMISFVQIASFFALKCCCCCASSKCSKQEDTNDINNKEAAQLPISSGSGSRGTTEQTAVISVV